MNTDIEHLLRRWGRKYFNGELYHLGYGLPPLGRLLSKGGGGVSEEIEAVDSAIVALNEREPELASVLIYRYGNDLTTQEIGTRLPDEKGRPRHRNTIAGQINTAIAWISGYLVRDEKTDGL